MIDYVLADAVKWCENYEGELFHVFMADMPYHLTSGNKQGQSEIRATYPNRDALANSGYCGKTSAPFGMPKSESTGFMGKKWDGGDMAFDPKTWLAFKKVLHPGAFGMAFAGSRGWHRMACAIEDAGFIIHPTIFLWSFGSGFPKATRIDTQCDKEAGAEREIIGKKIRLGDKKAYPYPETSEYVTMGKQYADRLETAPATESAKQWQSHRYGLQALKPAVEPIIVFQKPYPKGKKPYQSIVETGAGALNIDRGRIGGESWGIRNNKLQETYFSGKRPITVESHSGGRWPSNFILQHAPGCQCRGVKKVENKSGDVRGTEPSKPLFGLVNRVTKFDSYGDSDGLETVADWDCVDGCTVKLLGEQSGESVSSDKPIIAGDFGKNGVYGKASGTITHGHSDTGTASRYFFNSDWAAEIAAKIADAQPVCYCPKAARKERDKGLEGHSEKIAHAAYGDFNGDGIHAPNTNGKQRNPHPTVKPQKLLRYLAGLLLPPEHIKARAFNPCGGSGSEAAALLASGFHHVTYVEMEKEYFDIAVDRVPALCGLKIDGQDRIYPQGDNIAPTRPASENKQVVRESRTTQIRLF